MTEDDTFDALKYRTYNPGYKRWEWKNDAGQIHREDGPAVEYDDGSKFWFVNGKQHRIGGPAVVLYDGTEEYWIDGIYHTKHAYYRNRTKDIHNAYHTTTYSGQ